MERPQRFRAASIAAVLLLALAGRATGQGVLFVDADAPPGGNGLAWSTAFDDLSLALVAAAIPGSGISQLWVAEGTYVPTVRVDPVQPRSATFPLLSGVEILGGFSGTETMADERDWGANPTILSGDLSGNDLPGAVGVDENSYHVSRAIGVQGAVLDGFTVTGGHAVGPFSTVLNENEGGGLYVETSELAVRNCGFSDNTSFREGGAIRLFGGGTSLTVEHSSFSGNRSLDDFGGAIDGSIGTTVIVRSTSFSGNTCYEQGGAISSRSGTLTVEDSEFVANFAFRGGAGIRAETVSLIVRGCTFESGLATQTGGGGILVSYGTAAIISCVFLGCETPRRGGAIVSYSTSIDVWSSLFLGNSADEGGGAFDLHESSFEVQNCAILGCSSGPEGAAVTITEGSGTVGSSTIAGNVSSGRAGGVWLDGPNEVLVIRNSILWENTGTSTTGERSQLCSDRGAEFDISSTTIQGWTGLLGGTGNAGQDPLFADAEGRLGPVSPAVGAGSAASLPPDTFDLDADGDTTESIPSDLDGGLRLEGALDLGPFEGTVPCGAPLLVDCDGNGVPDECDPDCNGNGIADACDLTAGTSSDADADGIPDECQPDCNGNGIADSADLSVGTSVDCDADGVPDECQAAQPWPAFSGVDPSIPPGSFSVDEGALALGGDTIAFGVSNSDVFALNAGMVVILEPSGGGWDSSALLSSNPAVVQGGFGDAVSMSGNFLLIGANSEPVPGVGSSAGAAYIFERVGGTWVQQQRLQPDVPQASALFGGAVDIDGDVAVVGADGYDAQLGRVFVFRRTGGVWVQEGSLVPADIEPTDRFGGAVGVSGDWIISRTLDDDLGSAAGAAYLYRHTGAVWTEYQKLAPTDLDDGDSFGRAVAVSAAGIALIGASGKDDTTVDSGVAYVYSFDGALWRLEDKLRPEIQPSGDQFGRTVEIAETSYGPIALVATIGGAFSGPPDPGQVHLFHRLHGVWQPAALLQGSPAGVQDYFGFAIATDGNRAVVSAPLVAAEAGALHVYHGLGFTDCDLDGADDQCQLLSGLAADCNGNGFLDACDIASGSSRDADGDGVPDECLPELPFRRGDANADGFVDIADPIFLLNTFFTGGPTPPCGTAGDANDDGAVDIGDPIFLLAHLFDPLASPPPAPFPGCGPDPTPDSPTLGCATALSCP